MAQIEIEKEFAKCIKAINGVLLDEMYRDSPSSKADYWFPEWRVVAELKILSQNTTEKKDFRQQVTALYQSWVNRELVPPLTKRRTLFNLKDIPVQCAYEYLDIIKKRLEFSTIKKANRQIKITKQSLNAPDAKGLLLLANDGNLMMKPDMMAHLVVRIIKGQYSSIHSVIYFTANQVAAVPGVPLPALMWIDGVLPDREPIPLSLRQRLVDCWLNHHASLVSDPCYRLPLNHDPNFIEQIRFIDLGVANTEVNFDRDITWNS